MWTNILPLPLYTIPFSLRLHYSRVVLWVVVTRVASPPIIIDFLLSAKNYFEHQKLGLSTSYLAMYSALVVTLHLHR